MYEYAIRKNFFDKLKAVTSFTNITTLIIQNSDSAYFSAEKQDELNIAR